MFQEMEDSKPESPIPTISPQAGYPRELGLLDWLSNEHDSGAIPAWERMPSPHLIKDDCASAHRLYKRVKVPLCSLPAENTDRLANVQQTHRYGDSAHTRTTTGDTRSGEKRSVFEAQVC